MPCHPESVSSRRTNASPDSSLISDYTQVRRRNRIQSEHKCNTQNPSAVKNNQVLHNWSRYLSPSRRKKKKKSLPHTFERQSPSIPPLKKNNLKILRLKWLTPHSSIKHAPKKVNALQGIHTAMVFLSFQQNSGSHMNGQYEGESEESLLFCFSDSGIGTWSYSHCRAVTFCPPQ